MGVALRYAVALDRRPLQTKMLTSAMMFCLSDAIAQLAERASTRPPADRKGVSLSRMPDVSLSRLAKFWVCGFFQGAVGHNLYKWTDNILIPRYVKFIFPQSKVAATVATVAFDQLIWTPFWYIAYFFPLFGVLDGALAKGVQAWVKYIKAGVAGALSTVWLKNILVWGPGNFILFHYVPTALKPPIGNLIAMVWGVILSMSTMSTKKKAGERRLVRDAKMNHSMNDMTAEASMSVEDLPAASPDAELLCEDSMDSMCRRVRAMDDKRSQENGTTTSWERSWDCTTACCAVSDDNVIMVTTCPEDFIDPPTNVQECPVQSSVCEVYTQQESTCHIRVEDDCSNKVPSLETTSSDRRRSEPARSSRISFEDGEPSEPKFGLLAKIGLCNAMLFPAILLATVARSRAGGNTALVAFLGKLLGKALAFPLDFDLWTLP